MEEAYKYADTFGVELNDEYVWDTLREQSLQRYGMRIEDSLIPECGSTKYKDENGKECDGDGFLATLIVDAIEYSMECKEQEDEFGN